ncbi:MAG: HIT domain-containing protein [Candidatus Omnitrophica bacterium]|nr:HIT domain-containing protein [Candidatus Omnitrophota bacterium]MCM8802020.1 HIT domain-containing protein [Candidatus Omnitrophota bacterium]
MSSKDIIWAPWRIGYILGIKKDKCFLCDDIDPKTNNYVIYKGKYSFVIMNIYPYNNGHIMVAPLRHIKDIEELRKREIDEIYNLIKISVKILKKNLKPEGFNIGLNLGKISGAGIKDHLHIHIVPRWQGDTNFMPVISNTKIIPQSLNELAKILKKEFKKKI